MNGKLRHAAAFALVGRYLMITHFQRKTESGALRFVCGCDRFERWSRSRTIGQSIRKATNGRGRLQNAKFHLSNGV
jgi:hypothetical protein